MALVKRRIDVTFVLGKGEFGSDGSNQVKVSGLRCTARVKAAGGHAAGELDLVVYGMTLSSMNQISTLGMVATTYRKNSVTVEAGEEGGLMATVFQGQIIDAWIDPRGAPDVAFRITATTGLFDSVRPAKPLSFKSQVDVSTVLSGLATEMGLAFENNGVNVKLPPSYYAGSPREQAQRIVDDAGIKWNTAENGVLAIWTADGSRNKPAIKIDRTTGMIGYPTFTSNGIMLEAVFQPSVGLGGKIEVKSDFTGTGKPDAYGNTGANGTWVIYSFDLDLTAQVPRGAWRMLIQAAPVGLGPFVPGR